jgi:hypothetical protein
VTVEHPSTASSKPETADHAFEEELEAEHGLGRAIIIGVLVAVPINLVVWVGLVAFAVSRSGSALGGPIAMAVGLGVLSGLFFGSWAAFVAKHICSKSWTGGSIPEAAARVPGRPTAQAALRTDSRAARRCATPERTSLTRRKNGSLRGRPQHGSV